MPAKKQPAIPLQSLLDKSRTQRQLDADYTTATDNLSRAYQRKLAPLRAAIQALTARISELSAKSEERLTVADVRGLRQYRELLARAETEMQDYSAVARSEAGTLQDKAIETGIAGALELTALLSFGLSAAIRQAWRSPSPETMTQIITFADSEVFRDRASTFGANAAENLGSVIDAAVGQGRGADVIGKLLDNWLALPYSWSVNSTSTLQMYSYRAANHLSYLTNPNVLSGWMWWATIGSPTTCMSCIEQHGTIHELTETLNDHNQGRCTPAPIVVGSTWVNDIQTGQDWFEEQSAAAQRAQMGNNALFEAWKAGAVAWGQFGHDHTDDVFGSMRTPASLKGILGETARQYYGMKSA